MRQQLFEAQYGPLWTQLHGWLEGQPTLGAEEVPPAYRQLCHHLAVARERHYSPALVDRLQALALRLHQRLYGVQRGGLQGALDFLLRDLPRQARTEWRLMSVSALLFFAPLVATFLVVRAHPNLVHLVMSPQEAAQLARMYDPAVKATMDFGGASRDVVMFGYYIFNNIGIDFQIFASGLLLGVGPLYYVVFNGLHIGAAMAHVTNLGFTATFYGFVSGHSSFELIGIVFSGAGGLRMGLGLLHPGRRSRREALKDGARRGARLLFGAAILTFIAACFEGFWSANSLVPWKVKVAVGLAFWTLLLLWIGFAGRRSR